MCKRVMIGLFTMSVVALVWTDANAGCCCNPRMCASWITGNAICYLKTIGSDPTSMVTCQASGTVGDGCNMKLDKSCDMRVVVTCGPPPDNQDNAGDNVGGDNVRTVRATLEDTRLTDSRPFTHCQDGPFDRCKTFVSLEPSLEALEKLGVCMNLKDHPTPETATPTEFNAKSCIKDKCITYRCALPPTVVEGAIRLGQSLAYVCVPRTFTEVP